MTNLYLRALGAGVLAGMRSMSAPAFVSHHYAHGPKTPLAQSSLSWLASPTTAAVFTVLAAGEFVGDKLPNTPNRIAPGPLGGRAVSGGVCGAAIFLAEDKPALVGAAVGTAAAIAATYAAFYLRRRAGQVSKLPDPALAVVEDGLALALGKWLFFDSGSK